MVHGRGGGGAHGGGRCGVCMCVFPLQVVCRSHVISHNEMEAMQHSTLVHRTNHPHRTSIHLTHLLPLPLPLPSLLPHTGRC